MRSAPIVVLLLFSVFSYADSSLTAKREAALKAINACMQSHEVSSRQCKKLNANVQALVDVYKQGDKSVLPTLFKFTYLSDFFDDALLEDPVGFLSALDQLQRKDQTAVAAGIAGGMFGLPNRERFESIRNLLSQIPETDANKGMAQICLKELERQNASFLVAYFPPQTLTSRAAELQVRWYSAEMYALGEKPLWPAAREQGSTYRLTYLPPFTGPTVITLTSGSDNQLGHMSIKSVAGDRETTKVDETTIASRDQISEFFSVVDQAHFWTTPTELPRRGLDGAEWIMEGVSNGQYRVVVRWCPDVERQSTDEILFARAGRLLFELAGQKRSGTC